jgi:hypothetical protein
MGLMHSVDAFFSRKKIRRCEADMLPEEVSLFRRLLKSHLYREAYALVMQRRPLGTERPDASIRTRLPRTRLR